MTELWEVVKNMWPYWLVFAGCFLISIEYIRSYYEGLVRQKDEAISDLVFNDNEMVYKYNTLVDKYNEIYDFYKLAYNLSQHNLVTLTFLCGYTMKVFTQIIYNDSQMMFITNSINLKTMKSNVFFSKRGYNPKGDMI